MSDADAIVRDLGDRLKAGDPAASCELLTTYEPHLRRQVRHQLSPRVLVRVGIEDVVQDVWLRFVRKLDSFQFSTEVRFKALLRVLVHSAAKDAHRKFLGSKHYPKGGVGSLDEAAKDDLAFATKGPSPVEIAVLHDELHRIVTIDPRLVPVVPLLFEGYTVMEMVVMLGLTERTLERLLQRLRGFLQAEQRWAKQQPH